jgi:integrase
LPQCAIVSAHQDSSFRASGQLHQPASAALNQPVLLDRRARRGPFKVISALRCAAADLQQGRIWILEAVYRGKLDSPKTHRSARPVYLDRDTLERLREYKQRFLPSAKNENFLFPSAKGNTPVSYVNVLNRWIRPIWRKLGLTRTHWLLLRHWAGTEGANNGVPPKTLHEQLGHASITTTMKYYVHVDEEQCRKAAEVIGRRVGRAPEMLHGPRIRRILTTHPTR